MICDSMFSICSYLLNTKYTVLFLLWNVVRNIYVHVYL